MSGIFSVATGAMSASLAALQATSHNIANVNTPGYSRQQAQVQSLGGQATGSGFFGGGVQVSTVTRAYNQFLTTQANVASAQAATDMARLSQLEQLEGVFPTGPAGLGQAAGSFLNAFGDVVANPQDPAARQVVLSQAQELATRFQNASGQIGQLQAGVASDVRNTVDTVNALAGQVASLNQQIAAVQGNGHAPNDLLDQRDRLVAEINDLVQVTTIPADDGSLGLFIGGGQQLVLGQRAQTLSVIPGEYDRSQVRLAISDGSAQRPLPSSTLTGGSLAGLLRFQDQDLGSARNLLGQMAMAISEQVNQQQALGLDLDGKPGEPVFAPLTKTGRALPYAGNSSASVALEVTDASRLQASDYELRVNPQNSSELLLTRLSDGDVEPLTNSAGNVYQSTENGFTIQLDDALQPGDRFLLQPVANAASNMQVDLKRPAGIAAAAPFTATLGAANTGTADVASLLMSDPLNQAGLGQTHQLEVQQGSNGLVWTLAGADLDNPGTSSWPAEGPITLDGITLTLNGVPRAGDTLNIQPTHMASANSGNAQALLGLRDAAMVGGATITDAYASAMANIGVRVQGARTAAELSATVAQDATTRLANATGVDLDEEAARLIQYQQSYQAAARVLQVAQSVFDSLLQATA